MRKTLLTIALAAVAQMVLAQEKPSAETRKDAPAVESQSTAAELQPAAAESRESAEDPAPRRSIRVLRDPYDLASFYRSGGSSPEGWAGLRSDPSYRIASFYRSQEGTSPYGWSRFWTAGYGARRPVPLAPYRRTIGENGDLFLLVPFLAPVGPISGAFLGY